MYDFAPALGKDAHIHGHGHSYPVRENSATADSVVHHYYHAPEVRGPIIGHNPGYPHYNSGSFDHKKDNNS